MGPRGETGWGRSQPAAEGEGKLGREPQSAAGWAQPPDLPPRGVRIVLEDSCFILR